MSKARSATLCPRDPIGLSREEAASFLGISATHFQKLVDQGTFPRARALGGRLIWDADELSKSFRRLPYVGEDRGDDQASPYDPHALRV